MSAVREKELLRFQGLMKRNTRVPSTSPERMTHQLKPQMLHLSQSASVATSKHKRGPQDSTPAAGKHHVPAATIAAKPIIRACTVGLAELGKNTALHGYGSQINLTFHSHPRAESAVAAKDCVAWPGRALGDRWSDRVEHPSEISNR